MEGGDMIADKRFDLARRESKCVIDPRFKRVIESMRPARRESKCVIDPRFKRVIESMVEEESEEDDIDESIDEEESEEDDTDESIDETYGLQIPTDVPIETHRLAIVNMDWSRVSAKDLLLVLNPFLPIYGRILSVAVYPSECRIQRMREQEIHGPDNVSNHDYYAVAVCDSSATAYYLYTSCDGIEFERVSNKLDLRFIQDSQRFEHPPRDIAN